jgi:UDP-N-acetylmuramate: L-alanyl-gamma-D-glutamyl-meso-diaminopimelate ligase
LISPDGILIYCEDDIELKKICPVSRPDIKKTPYSLPPFTVESGVTKIKFQDEEIPLQIFGRHNLLNLNGARLVCNNLGISDTQFYSSIQSFKGASKRLERIAGNDESTIFKDFAHSPSKLMATLKAVKEQYPDKQLVACMELHTFSSLSQEFLSHYKGCMDAADRAIVYFNPHAIQLKKLPQLTVDQVRDGFANKNLEVYTDSDKLEQCLIEEDWHHKNLLMMSSGDFDGLDMNALAKKITSPHL